MHNDDLIYLFYIQKLFPLNKDTDPEVQTVNKLTSLWANFANAGLVSIHTCFSDDCLVFRSRNPTPETSDKLDNIKWEPYTSKDQKYLDIGNKLVLNEKLYEKRYAEWAKLFPLSQYTEKKS